MAQVLLNVLEDGTSKEVIHPVSSVSLNAAVSMEASAQRARPDMVRILAMNVVNPAAYNIFSHNYGWFDTSTGQLVDLWETITRAPLGARMFAARSNATPKSVLLVLAEDPSFAVRSKLVNNEDMPAIVLDRLESFENKFFVLREDIAKHKNTSVEMLARMAEKDKEPSVLANLAGNKNLSEETFWLLSKKKSHTIDQALASNYWAPPALLAQLATSNNEYTRQYVASNKNTPPETLVLLSEDPQGMVRSQVAFNTSTPPATLDQMLLRVEKSDGMSSDATLGVMESLSRNTSSPPETLRSLWEIAGWRFKEHLAKNVSSPHDLLATIAKDPSSDVRLLVASNKGATREILSVLAKDNNKVSAMAKKNPNYRADAKPPRRKKP